MSATVFCPVVDFSSLVDAINPSSLLAEIQKNSGISVVCDRVDVDDTGAHLLFRASLSTEESAALNSVVAAHTGVSAAEKKEVAVFSQVKPELDEVFVFSVNWADQTSWFPGSTRVEDQQLVCCSADRKHWAMLHRNIVDLCHSKITEEDKISEPYLTYVKVNGVLKTEKDAHSEVGDYIVDYRAGMVMFDEAVPVGHEVVADYSHAYDSTFVIAPLPGKVLRIQEAEAQFSADADMRDSVVYQAWGYAQALAGMMGVTLAQLTAALGLPANSLAATTKVPFGQPLVYKSIRDFINQANGNFAPLVPFGGTGWRGMGQQSSLCLPFSYKGAKTLPSSKGMEIRVSLQHHQPFGGTWATATFYALSEPEV